MFKSEFDSVVYVVYKEFESGEFCRGASKDEENVVNVPFPNEDVLAPFLVNDVFDFTHENVGVRWCVSSSHGCPCILYEMLILEVEVTVFEDEM